MLLTKKNRHPIAPLQPPILAAVKPWGALAGAGRKIPAPTNVYQ